MAFGRDWKVDAERRDFTMNALSISRDGVVHDYVGGLADLEARRVRFIGDPARRIAEDYLRILRFFRFQASYAHGAPDAAGLHACIVARDGLRTLSRERVRAELMKLLVAPFAVPTLAVMAETGFIELLLGGVPHARELRQHGQGRGGGRRWRRTRCAGSARSACSIAEDAERLLAAAAPLQCRA